MKFRKFINIYIPSFNKINHGEITKQSQNALTNNILQKDEEKNKLNKSLRIVCAILGSNYAHTKQKVSLEDIIQQQIATIPFNVKKRIKDTLDINKLSITCICNTQILKLKSISENTRSL